jgi:hypothetical protein
MRSQEKQIVKTTISANSRAEVIEKFTHWVKSLPFKHRFNLSIHGVIGDEPREIVSCCCCQKINEEKFHARMIELIQEVQTRYDYKN